MLLESPDGAVAVAPTSIVDDVGVVWSLSVTGGVLRNGIRRYVWAGVLLMWVEETNQLYLLSFTDRGYALDRYTGGATLLDANDPIVGVMMTRKPAKPAPLSITTSTLPTGQVNVPYTATIVATGGKPPYRFSIQSGSIPPGMTLAQSGAIGGTDSTLAGSFPFGAKVLDSQNASAAKALSIDVAPAAVPAPTITNPTATPSPVAAGGSVTIDATVTNATQVQVDRDTPGVLVVVTLPLVVNVTASRSFQIVAHGQTAPDATVSVSVTVQAATNQAPVWSPIPAVQFVKGTASTFDVKPYASDPNNDPLTFTLESGTLPAGVTFDPATARFSYDGIGAAASSIVSIGADDGK